MNMNEVNESWWMLALIYIKIRQFPWTFAKDIYSMIKKKCEELACIAIRWTLISTIQWYVMSEWEAEYDLSWNNKEAAVPF